MICTYRIYPNWFGGETAAPLRELTERAGSQMGRAVLAIVKAGAGFDQMRGHFVDFRVTYGSTEAPACEEVRR